MIDAIRSVSRTLAKLAVRRLITSIIIRPATAIIRRWGHTIRTHHLIQSIKPIHAFPLSLFAAGSCLAIANLLRPKTPAKEDLGRSMVMVGRFKSSPFLAFENISEMTFHIKTKKVKTHKIRELIEKAKIDIPEKLKEIFQDVEKVSLDKHLQSLEKLEKHAVIGFSVAKEIIKGKEKDKTKQITEHVEIDFEKVRPLLKKIEADIKTRFANFIDKTGKLKKTKTTEFKQTLKTQLEKFHSEIKKIRGEGNYTFGEFRSLIEGKIPAPLYRQLLSNVSKTDRDNIKQSINDELTNQQAINEFCRLPEDCVRYFDFAIKHNLLTTLSKFDALVNKSSIDTDAKRKILESCLLHHWSIAKNRVGTPSPTTYQQLDELYNKSLAKPTKFVRWVDRVSKIPDKKTIAKSKHHDLDEEIETIFSELYGKGSDQHFGPIAKEFLTTAALLGYIDYRKSKGVSFDFTFKRLLKETYIYQFPFWTFFIVAGLAVGLSKISPHRIHSRLTAPLGNFGVIAVGLFTIVYTRMSSQSLVEDLKKQAADDKCEVLMELTKFHAHGASSDALKFSELRRLFNGVHPTKFFNYQFHLMKNGEAKNAGVGKEGLIDTKAFQKFEFSHGLCKCWAEWQGVIDGTEFAKVMRLKKDEKLDLTYRQIYADEFKAKYRKLQQKLKSAEGVLAGNPRAAIGEWLPRWTGYLLVLFGSWLALKHAINTYYPQLQAFQRRVTNLFARAWQRLPLRRLTWPKFK